MGMLPPAALRSSVTALNAALHVVRLSGTFMERLPLPRLSVLMVPKNAVSLKSFLSPPPSPPSAPAPPSISGQ